MSKFTKIIATISDKHCEPEFIARLHDAGMNLVRLNSAHLQPDGLRKVVESVRSVSPEIAIILDTKGPEIRTTAVEQPLTAIEFRAGDSVVIMGDSSGNTPCTHENICVNYGGIVDDLRPGLHMIIDDGELDFEITDVERGIAHAVATNDGTLGSRKTVNIPGASIDLPAVSERDRMFIELAAELEVDFVAHSFVRSAADIAAVQAVIDACGSSMHIIAKIENQQGVDNFDSILEICYGVMIARGDLGIEVPAERIPAIQRMMISRCIAGHKPVIVATQMLHSMIHNPRPTRAEVTDVAEAVYQQADALMLSGETAAGRYPEQSVATMARIAREVEQTLAESLSDVPPLPDGHITSFLARQAVMSEIKIGTKAIVTDAYRGRTARFIASFRGPRPVYAVCNSLSVARRLALSYGITPFFYPDYAPAHRYPVKSMRRLIADGHLNPDDRIAYLGSQGGIGATFLEISTISEILSNS